MMISNARNDVGCGLEDTGINGLSVLYLPLKKSSESQRSMAGREKRYLLKMPHNK